MKKRSYLVYLAFIMMAQGLSTPMVWAAEARNEPKIKRIGRIKEAYRTFKNDMKCLLDRKKKCTPEQKKRIAKTAAVLIGAIAVTGLGVYGGYRFVQARREAVRIEVERREEAVRQARKIEEITSRAERAERKKEEAEEQARAIAARAEIAERSARAERDARVRAEIAEQEKRESDARQTKRVFEMEASASRDRAEEAEKAASQAGAIVEEAERKARESAVRAARAERESAARAEVVEQLTREKDEARREARESAARAERLEREKEETESKRVAGVTRELFSLVLGENPTEAQVMKLLSEGANINVQNIFGGTMLHDAASRGDEALVRLLLRNGAIVDVQDRGGKTPLHSAASRDHEAIVFLLLDSGADPTTIDLVDRTDPAAISPRVTFSPRMQDTIKDAITRRRAAAACGL